MSVSIGLESLDISFVSPSLVLFRSPCSPACVFVRVRAQAKQASKYVSKYVSVCYSQDLVAMLHVFMTNRAFTCVRLFVSWFNSAFTCVRLFVWWFNSAFTCVRLFVSWPRQKRADSWPILPHVCFFVSWFIMFGLNVACDLIDTEVACFNDADTMFYWGCMGRS